MKDSQFAHDVKIGLTSAPKYLKSKYFYDDKGSDLFQQIMNLPEYYLTRAELEIFRDKSAEIIAAIGGETFNIIELGAGDGFKTREFLRAIKKAQIDANYYPVDISKEALAQLQENLAGAYPTEKVELHHGDYFVELERLFSSDVKEVVLFLGSNIGNYDPPGATALLQLIGDNIKQGDVLLLGVDLKKNPQLIAQAYDDDQGVTRKFNLNLLERMNRELGANFALDKFDFYSCYNPETGEVKSYLVSLVEQDVFFSGLEQTFRFGKNELIYTELSKKYSLFEISALAQSAGYKLENYILDSNELFAECILEKL